MNRRALLTGITALCIAPLKVLLQPKVVKIKLEPGKVLMIGPYEQEWRTWESNPAIAIDKFTEREVTLRLQGWKSKNIEATKSS